MVILRISSFVTLFLVAVFLPWPVAAGLGVILVALFSWFWEIAAIGLLLGIVCGLKGNGTLIFSFFTASFAAALFAGECSKKIIEGENIFSRAIVAFSSAAAIFLFWCAFKLALNYV